MLFMLSSRPRPGVTRDQMIEHLTTKMNPATWDHVRHGTLFNIYYKTGDQPGFFALLSAPSLADAEKDIAETVRSVGAQSVLSVFDLDIFPVNQFPHFD